MKRSELKENEPITVPYGKFVAEQKSYDGTVHNFDECRFHKTIYTDGTILSKGEPIKASREDLDSVVKEYDCRINTLETSDLILKDYSYAIAFTIATKWAKVGNIMGWFNFRVKTDIYMKDPKDRKTLKVIKKLLEDIDRHNHSANYSSVWSYTFGQRRGLEYFEPTEIADYVYSMKKVK